MTNVTTQRYFNYNVRNCKTLKITQCLTQTGSRQDEMPIICIFTLSLCQHCVITKPCHLNKTPVLFLQHPVLIHAKNDFLHLYFS